MRSRSWASTPPGRSRSRTDGSTGCRSRAAARGSSAAAEGVTRIVVIHHPFDLPEGDDRRGLVGRADMAMAAFARCGVDMILSGHLHVSRRSASAVRYRIPGYSALMVQAGTATSSRRRGELNSYNIIRIERPDIAIDTLSMGRRARRLRPFGDGSVPIGTRRLVAGCRRDGRRCLMLRERGARGHRWPLPPCASACSSGWRWPPPPELSGASMSGFERASISSPPPTSRSSRARSPGSARRR